MCNGISFATEKSPSSRWTSRPALTLVATGRVTCCLRKCILSFLRYMAMPQFTREIMLTEKHCVIVFRYWFNSFIKPDFGKGKNWLGFLKKIMGPLKRKRRNHFHCACVRHGGRPLRERICTCRNKYASKFGLHFNGYTYIVQRSKQYVKTCRQSKMVEVQIHKLLD